MSRRVHLEPPPGPLLRKEGGLEDLVSGIRPTRREFLVYMSAMLTAAACGDDDGFVPAATGPMPPPAPTLATDPFTLGVASGDPEADRVILWTRLALDPTDAGAMPPEDVPVIWEVATDESFTDIVRSGWLNATPQFAHAVHVDADGLTPDTWYWYRFRIDGQWESPSAETRTLPEAGEAIDSFRIGIANCQSYTSGFYTAHHHLAQEDVDLIAFLGDYIYEGGGSGAARAHFGPKLRTLAHYRNRYGQYRSDPNLQASHQRCPWVVTWDDHEVSNNYAGLVLQDGEDDVEDVLALRRAAYQAYYEHMPLRIPIPDDFGHMEIHTSFDIGDLIRMYVLDGRQFRSDQPCGGGFVTCPEVDDPDQTMLGIDQKEWLKDELRASPATWNLIAQQTVFTPIVFRGFANTDQWDGYRAERQELLDLFREIRNVVILTGDIHLAGFGLVVENADDPDSAIVSYEVVTTSISSNGDGSDQLSRLIESALRNIPNIEHVNGANRGYTICDLNRERMRVEYRIVSTVLAETAELSTDVTFEIDAETFELEKFV